MAALSDYLENKLIDHLLRTATFSQPATIAIALCTSAPTDASTGATIVEVANANGYARKTLNPSNSNWTATQGGTSGASSGTAGISGNAITVEFDTATGSWGTVTHIAVCDSATWGAGNVLFYGPLETPTEVLATNIVTINTGMLTFAFDVCPAAESYTCTPAGCVDPGDGSGEFATIEECQAECSYIQFVKDSRGLGFLFGFSDGNLLGSTISSVEEGNLLVIFIETMEETAFIGSHTVAFKREPVTPVVFTLAGEIQNTFGGFFTQRLQAYYLENAPAGDYTVTITMTATSYPVGRYAVWDFLEYSNVASASALFASTSNTDVNESPTISAPSRNSVNDLIVAAYGTMRMAQDAPPVLVSTEYVARWLHNPISHVTMGIADYRGFSTPSSAEWAIQLPGSDDAVWNAIALSFKKAP